MASAAVSVTPDSAGKPDFDEEAEMDLIVNACREFCIGDCHEEEEYDARVVTLCDWERFREDIRTMKGVVYGSEKIIVGENGLLIKQSDGKPICSFLSCFSTDGTESNENNRCNKHVGQIKFGAIELEFIIDDNTIARHPVVVMFVVKPDDGEADIRRKMIQALKKSGHLEAIAIVLQKEKYIRNASQLREPDAVIPVKRYWIFDELKQALKKVTVLQFSFILLELGIYNDNKNDPAIPKGPLKGKRLVRVPEGVINVESESEPDLLKEVEAEQMESFGFCYTLSMDPNFDGELNFNIPGWPGYTGTEGR